MDIGFIVLAGGKGLRLGQDKASETIGDRSLLERVVSRLASFDSDILIVSASERTFPQLNGYPRLRTVADIYLNKGPLGGVYAGLKASDSFYNFVVACDMPFLNQALLRYMMQISAGFDLVVPRLGELVEPLHAVYSRACLAPIESLLRQGDLILRRLFALVEVRYVEAEEIDRFDPQHLSFFNVNNEADMERAKKLARSEL
ncbi:MAG: molybdenum cofactor guanylyltransferase [Dehalococcoidales bacterium]|nr:molybdenum cofactor guanylyltransferase [Dehalococcoidales bacterium]